MDVKEKNIVFLFSELSGYFLACLKTLTEYSVHVIHFPINPEAPFEFDDLKTVQFYPKKNYDQKSLSELVQHLNPDIIICAGWIDKEYLAITKKYYRKIPTVVTLDNPWDGSLKQTLLSLSSPFYLKKIFSHIWIPGKPQLKYAQKLGFKEDKIIQKFYSADVNSVDEHGHILPGFYNQQQILEYKQQNPNSKKRFLYIGRYVKHKGIFDLWNAFIQLKEEYPNDWELWCIGTGPLFNEKTEHPDIKHLGFIQPKDIPRHIAQTSVFVLPSHFEPWGVVIHELAACGLPIICSNKVGAATQFVEHEKNGFLFEAGNEQELKKYLKSCIQMTDNQLNELGNRSNALSQSISPFIWRQNLLKMLDY